MAHGGLRPPFRNEMEGKKVLRGIKKVRVIKTTGNSETVKTLVEYEAEEYRPENMTTKANKAGVSRTVPLLR